MYYIGIDIGGTNTKIGLVSKDYQLITLCKFPTPNDIINALFDEIKGLFNENYIVGIGIGVAGLVGEDGTVIESPNIPTLNKIPLASLITEKFAVKTRVDNDATAATIAEANFGEGKGTNRFILLTLGTGIGGGFYIDGKILNIPMEAGHMSIDYQGKLCSCGNNGCLEMYASGRAIRDTLIEKIEEGAISQAKSLYEGNFYKIKSEDVYRLALEGDNLSRQVIKEAGKALGVGMANIINIFSPEKIILTGGLSNAKNIYLEAAINEAKKRALKGLTENIKIIRSQLIDSGGVLGAVFLLRNQ
ncbi:MAG: ROK family protein [Thermodesulfovibrio sp.]|nr:ROK family protein [Thermodesulfovibrio sp.]